MTPRERYHADLDRQGFRADPAQRRAVDYFQSLYERLTGRSATARLWKRLVGFAAAPVAGIYLWGGPGRGKTYLMDCFYESLPFKEKRRVHFHRFMLNIHEMLDALPRTPNPLHVVAGKLASDCRVLCLDEFHVTDIADAMLLSGLLEALFARQVTLVATSNTAPEGLYRDGLQRDRFLPVIDLLNKHTRVCCLDGKEDFRLSLLRESGTYRVVSDGQGREWLSSHLRELAAVEARFDSVMRLFGREFRAVALADDIAWFRFDSLCLEPRSARDYLELAREFHTMLLEGVPLFTEDMDEAARRFMHLIDALYDHRVKLVMTAEAMPANLYQGVRLERSFQRTASRLTEMSSVDYLARPHRPD